MKYTIGQQVWVADFQPMDPTYVVCPDCGGTGRLHVTFHDETQVSIDCRNCASGYDPPTGRVKVYRQHPGARLATITGVDIDGEKSVWKTTGGWVHDEGAIFDTEEAATAYAFQQQEDYQLEQVNKIEHKEKDTRTWAWNASYHRREIERARKQIEYHSAKLAVAVIQSQTG